MATTGTRIPWGSLIYLSGIPRHLPSIPHYKHSQQSTVLILFCSEHRTSCLYCTMISQCCGKLQNASLNPQTERSEGVGLLLGTKFWIRVGTSGRNISDPCFIMLVINGGRRCDHTSKGDSGLHINSTY